MWLYEILDIEGHSIEYMEHKHQKADRLEAAER